MSKSRCWLLYALVVVALIAAGCDNQPGDESTSQTATLADSAADLMLFTPTQLPPTWTPSPVPPTNTPRPTEEITRVRPTATELILPTYTPSPVPPTSTPLGPALLLTSDQVYEALNAEVKPAVGNMFVDSPRVTFKDGDVFIDMNVPTTPGDLTDVRAVQIRGRMGTAEGRVAITITSALYLDDKSDFTNDLGKNLVTELETQINKLVLSAYNKQSISTSAFYVSEVETTDDGLLIHTVTLDSTGSPG